MADILVNNPKGQPVVLDDSEYQNALKNGYSAATPEQNQDYQKESSNQQQYGEGVMNPIKSAALGAGEMASFGGINQLLVHGGIMTPEEIQQIEQRNPVSHVVGEVGGLAGSVLGGNEAAPVNAVGALGRGVSRVAEDVLPGAASGVLKSIGTTALGSAAEGALYGAGNLVNDNALGDADLNSEKLMSYMGHGAILGGALGGALKAGEIALPASYNAAKDGVNKLYDMAVGAPGEEPGFLTKGYAKAASAFSDQSYGEILDAAKGRGEPITDVKGFSSTLQDTVDAAEKLTKDVYQKGVKEADIGDMLKDHDPNVALNEWTKTGDALGQKIKELEENEAPKMYTNELRKAQSRFEDSVSDGASSADVYQAMNKLKQEIDPLAKFQKGSFPNATEKYAIDAVRDLRGNIKTSLEDSQVWGDAAAKQSSLNSAMSDYFDNVKDFRKTFMTKIKGQDVVSPMKVQTYLNQIGKTGGDFKGGILSDFVDSSRNFLDASKDSFEAMPSKEFNADHVEKILSKSKEAMDAAESGKMLQDKGGPSVLKDSLIFGGAHALGVPGIGAAAVAAREAFGVLKNPGSTLGRLASIERMAGKVTDGIESMAGRIFRPSIGVAQHMKGALVLNSYEDKDRKFNKIQDQLNESIGTPQMAVDKLHNATKELGEAAPNIAGSMSQKLTAATMFLKSKMPDTSPPGPLSPPIKPSGAELSKFFRYYDVVENPMLCLKQVRDGNLMAESMEAMQNVYPKLLSEMQSKVMDKLTDKMGSKSNIPFKTKMMLSMFLGEDMVGSLNPQNLARNYAAMTGPSSQQDSQQAAAQQAKPRAAAKNLSIADRSQTDMRATAERGEA